MNIALLGGGSWGTALSVLLSQNGNSVKLYERTPETAEEMARTRENKIRLEGVVIDPDVFISSDLDAVLDENEMIVFAVPSHSLREVARRLSGIDLEGKIAISVVKGIENDMLKRMSEVLEEELAPSGLEDIVALSGPSHAEEVVRCIPTTVVAASKRIQAAQAVQGIFMSPSFRVYTNSDLLGVELGGALKNIIALASGMCDGLGFGDNTKGALISRGLLEIVRLGTAMGADAATFYGLSGIGDIVTTCASRHSRNRYVGEQVGKGRKLKDVLSEMTMVAEGVKTTKSALQLSQKFEVEMPITEQVHSVLFQDKDPKDAVSQLMIREAKPET